MTDKEMPFSLFIERDPDHYVLASGEDEALEAAWRVLRAFELRRKGSYEHYDDGHKDEVLGSLRDGIEERPYGGIFAVELYGSLDVDGQINLLVSNRNGRHDKRYTGILKDVVQLAGADDLPQDS